MRGQTGGQDDWITFLDDGKGIYLGYLGYCILCS